MDPEEYKKKVNDDLVVFMRKRSDTQAPRYTARLKTYVDFQEKHRRANAARNKSGKKRSNSKNRLLADDNEKAVENANRQPDEENSGMGRKRSVSRSNTVEPEDRCCRRKRRRRRSCGRRRRRRRSGCRRRRRRRSCRRRRRRSCSRRRRRRSCCRRRRRRRRCGC